MSRFARRVDANHSQIVNGLRKCGVYVADTSRVGNGMPDILCCVRDRVTLLEIKDPSQPPSKRALTPQEKEFFNAYPGPVFVVHSVEQALEVLGLKASRSKRGPYAERSGKTIAIDPTRTATTSKST